MDDHRKGTLWRCRRSPNVSCRWQWPRSWELVPSYIIYTIVSMSMRLSASRRPLTKCTHNDSAPGSGRMTCYLPRCRCFGFDHRVTECRTKYLVYAHCSQIGHVAVSCSNEVYYRDCAFRGLPDGHILRWILWSIYSSREQLSRCTILTSICVCLSVTMSQELYAFV